MQEQALPAGRVCNSNMNHMSSYLRFHRATVMSRRKVALGEENAGGNEGGDPSAYCATYFAGGRMRDSQLDAPQGPVDSRSMISETSARRTGGRLLASTLTVRS